MTIGDRRSKGKKPRPEVARYWSFVSECKLKGVELPVQGATVIFYMPFPPSYSKTKRAALLGRAHQLRPDLSNLLKALEDAVYTDDAKIWHYGGLAKVWSETGAIQITGPGEKPFDKVGRL